MITIGNDNKLPISKQVHTLTKMFYNDFVWMYMYSYNLKGTSSNINLFGVTD